MKDTYISKSDHRAYITIISDMIFTSDYWQAGREKATKLAEEIMDTLNPQHND